MKHQDRSQFFKAFALWIFGILSAGTLFAALEIPTNIDNAVQTISKIFITPSGQAPSLTNPAIVTIDANASGSISALQVAGNILAGKLLGSDANTLSGLYSTIVAGLMNILNGNNSVIVGGNTNTLTGENSLIFGGENNKVNGNYATAGGYKAIASGDSTWVWSDYWPDYGDPFAMPLTTTEFTSTNSNQFLIRAFNGVGINTNRPYGSLQVNGTDGSTGLVVGYTGNVGIGTTNPRALLDVGAYKKNGAITTVLGRQLEGDTTAEGTALLVRAWGTQQGWATYYGKMFSIDSIFYGTINSSISFWRGAGWAGGFMTFSTNNGNERMRITSGGNVGIGYSYPSEKLVVNGDINVLSDTSSYLLSGADALSRLATQIRVGISNIFTNLGLFTNGVERLTIASGGNVGIGTTGPIAKLHVIGDIALYSLYSHDNIRLWHNMLAGYLDVGGAENGFQIRVNGTNNGNPLSQTYMPAITIASGGNVGIGTTGPTSKLDVDGRVHISGFKVSTTRSNSLTFTDANDVGAIWLGEDNKLHVVGFANVAAMDNGLSSPGFQPKVAGVGQKMTFMYGDINLANYAGIPTYIRSENQDLKLQPDAPYNTLINPNTGNVGIGTTGPTEKLQVAGNIKAPGLYVKGTGAIASGNYSTAIGYNTYAKGVYSFAAGYGQGISATVGAIGDYSTSLGYNTRSAGPYSTSLGYATQANRAYSTAMGYTTEANSYYSTAMGYTTKANGYMSTAMGGYTQANGDYSTAMGYNTRVNGAYSTAMGYATNANYMSTAMGGYTSANSYYSTAMGYATNANGGYSTAMGYATNANGGYSTAMGNSTQANGESSTAMGYNTRVDGAYSTAMGNSTQANAESSTAMGKGTQAYGYNSLVIGKYNQPSSDSLFEVGNGYSDSLRSTAFSIRDNGALQVYGRENNTNNLCLYEAEYQPVSAWNRVYFDGNSYYLDLWFPTRYIERWVNHSSSVFANRSVDHSISQQHYLNNKGTYGYSYDPSVSYSYHYTYSYSYYYTNNDYGYRYGYYVTDYNNPVANWYDSNWNYKSIIWESFPDYADGQPHSCGLEGFYGDYFYSSNGYANGIYLRSVPYAQSNKTFTISNYGHVGIGIDTSYLTNSDSQYKFQVASNSLFNGNVAISNTTTSSPVLTVSQIGKWNALTPNYALSVDGYSNLGGIRISGLDDISILQLNKSPLSLATSSLQSPIIFSQSNVERMRIASGGKIGVGVTTPVANFDVNGTIRASESIETPLLIVDKLVNRTVTNITISGQLLPDMAAPVAYRTIGSSTAPWSQLYLHGLVANGTGVVAASNSTAMGNKAKALGESSTAMGYQTTASGAYSTAMGNANKALGESSTAMGFRTTASGNSSTAMGRNTKAFGGSSTAMGVSTQALASFSTAMGNGSVASGVSSTAIGYGTLAIGEASIALGMYNVGNIDSIFEVGIGTPIVRRTLLDLKKNGAFILNSLSSTVTSCKYAFQDYTFELSANDDTEIEDGASASLGDVLYDQTYGYSSSTLLINGSAPESTTSFVDGQSVVGPCLSAPIYVFSSITGTRLVKPFSVTITKVIGTPTYGSIPGLTVSPYGHVGIGVDTSAYTTTDITKFAVNGSSYFGGDMSIRNGNVAINTYPSTLYKLSVKGTGSFTKLAVGALASSKDSLVVGGNLSLVGSDTNILNRSTNSSLSLGIIDAAQNTTSTINGSFVSFFGKDYTNGDVRGNINLVVDNSTNPNASLNVLGFNGSASYNRLFINGYNGNIGIGTTSPSERLQILGNVKADGYYYSSDITLKKDITSLDNALEKINQLNGYSFSWKSNDKKDIGVIAQEVEKVFPEIVHADNTGIKSVEYANLVAPIIEAIKSLTHKIEDLFAKYVDQEARINALESRLQRLEAHK